jgi:hypothetical protein
VGKTAPSTATNSPKGTGTTRSVSGFNISDAENAGGRGVVVRPPRKFGVRKLAIIRAST